MADLTITTPHLLLLHPALVKILTLTPPPTPKGRYVLQKAAGHTEIAYAAYAKEDAEHVLLVAVKGEDGNPILTPIDGGMHYNVIPDLKEEHEAHAKERDARMVTLPGCRMITHAELGDCPITGAQEKI